MLYEYEYTHAVLGAISYRVVCMICVYLRYILRSIYKYEVISSMILEVEDIWALYTLVPKPL